MPREVSITLTLPMAPEAFWALRLDHGFDAYFADLDKQILHCEADHTSTDAQGLACVCPPPPAQLLDVR